MADRTVEATWLGDYLVDATAGTFTVRVDEPIDVGGGGTGPQPTDFLLMSVASCFAMALAYSARKRTIPISRIGVTVTGSYDGPRFSAINIRASTDAPVEMVEQLVESARRVCYVTNTLQNPPQITVTHAP